MGLDKNLVCCDIKTKKTILKIQCEHPLTCADFEQDGVTLCVGTSRGKILVYDLRSPQSALHNIAAHNSSVTSAVFKQKPSSPPSGVSGLSSGRSRTRLSQQKSASSLKPVLEEGKENNDPVKKIVDEEFSRANENMFSYDKKDESIIPAASNRRESLSSMLFSPLRDTDTSLNSHISASISRDIDSRLGLTSRPGSETRRFSSDSVFSPLKDSPGPGSAGVSINKRTPFTSFNTPPSMSPLTIIRDESKLDQTSSNTSSAGVKVSQFNGKEKLSLESLENFVKETIDPGSASPAFAPPAEPALDHVVSAPVCEPGISNVSVSSSSRHSSASSSSTGGPRSSEFNNILTAFPSLVSRVSSTSSGSTLKQSHQSSSVNDFRY